MWGGDLRTGAEHVSGRVVGLRDLCQANLGVDSPYPITALIVHLTYRSKTSRSHNRDHPLANLEKSATFYVPEPENYTHAHTEIALPLALQASRDIIGLKDTNGEARLQVNVEAAAESQRKIRPTNQIDGAEGIRFDKPCMRDTADSVRKPVCLATAYLEFWTKQGLRRNYSVIGIAKGRRHPRPSGLDPEVR